MLCHVGANAQVLITAWQFFDYLHLAVLFSLNDTALSLLSELQAASEVLQLPTAEILELYFAEGARHRLRAKNEVSFDTAAMKVSLLHMHPFQYVLLCPTVHFKGGGIASCLWVRQLSFQRRLSGTACCFLRSWNARNCKTCKLFATACKYSWAAKKDHKPELESEEQRIRNRCKGVINQIMLSKLSHFVCPVLEGLGVQSTLGGRQFLGSVTSGEFGVVPFVSLLCHF